MHFSCILTSTSLLTIKGFFVCVHGCYLLYCRRFYGSGSHYVVYTGRTSEYYPIIQQRHEKPGQAEGGPQENNSTDQVDEQTPLRTHSQFSLELLKAGWRRGLELHAGASGVRGPGVQSLDTLIWKFSIL